MWGAAQFVECLLSTHARSPGFCFHTLIPAVAAQEQRGFNPQRAIQNSKEPQRAGWRVNKTVDDFLFFLDFYLFYIYRCFVCMYSCTPCAFLASEEAREDIESPGTGVRQSCDTMWVQRVEATHWTTLDLVLGCELSTKHTCIHFSLLLAIDDSLLHDPAGISSTDGAWSGNPKLIFIRILYHSNRN